MTDTRFDQLMYAAGLTAAGCFENMDGYDQQAIQKFAELIVEECAAVIATAVDHREPASTYAAKIREHFGVQ